MANIGTTALGEPPGEKLCPPFSPDYSAASAESCLADLPASIIARGRKFRPPKDLRFYLRSELETWKIDRIYDYLWFARDRLMQARSLHRHAVSRRQIVLTESPSEHLVSDYSVVFIKPLPSYLLSYEFWERHLSYEKDLHSAACGLLLSYTWLVAYKTDFNIAKELRLLPEGVSWNAWTAFASSFLDHLESSEIQLVSKRYVYGELRMGRINYIHKLIPSLWFSDNPMRGFMPTSMWNGSFMERNITRLLGIFVFFSLILTAMQVGLATKQLQDNVSFVSASYGFVIASLFIVLLTAVISLITIIWHVRYKIILPWSLGLQEMRGHDF